MAHEWHGAASAVLSWLAVPYVADLQ